MTWGFNSNSGSPGNVQAQGWGNYLQNQIGGYSQNAPQAPNVTQPGPWQDTHRAVMGDMLSGQRNQMDEYVKRAGATGVQRGGFTNPNQPQLQYEAIKNLAGGYGDRYNSALAYTQGLADYDQRNYQTQAQTYSNLVNAANQYQSGTEQRELEAYLQQKAGESAMAQLLQQQQWQGGQSELERQQQTAMQQAQAQAAADLARQQQTWQTRERTGTQQYQSIQDALQRQLAWNSLVEQLKTQKYGADLGYMSSLAGSII